MRISALVLFLIIATSVVAQGNLQFNQVVTYTGTGSGSFSYTSPTWTVPVGKVWKIESASPNLGNTAVSRAVNINAGASWGSFALTTSSQETTINPFPIWLKAGDLVQLQAAGNCCSTTSFSYAISILEFNIVP
ncbi:MAG: hypothetical protein RLZZ198_1804 [Bacteroidota bacterium]|jgi:hypothetical protein